MPGCQRNVADSSTLRERHDSTPPYAMNGRSMSVLHASSATASASRTTSPSRKPVVFAGLFARYAGRERYKVTDRIEARVLAWTTKQLPADGSTHWSSRKLAAELGDISHMTVSRIWACSDAGPQGDSSLTTQKVATTLRQVRCKAFA